MQASPFARIGGGTVIVVSLIGHYERIAQYLFREDALPQYPGVTSMVPLRVKARSPWSLMRACWVMARHLLTRPGVLVGIPRSNSRAIRMLAALFFRARYFTYSDGLGDSIHRFFMENSPNYVGHVGFASLSKQPLIHEIPLTECIEPWGERITFDDRAPVLVIVKSPKETTFDVQHLSRLYARTITTIARHRPVLLSGGLPGLDLPASLDVRPLGPLMGLTDTLPISAAVGLPSTAFLTLAMKLPVERLRIMRLCCERSHPDANRRIKSMKQTLERCMSQLIPHSNAPPPLPVRLDARNPT
jgi:hypothetical protein